MKKYIAIISLIFLFSMSLKAQFNEEYYAGIGLSTTKIIGDNPNTFDFGNPDSDIIGGSFNEWQPGIDLRLLFVLNESRTLRLPIGIDYQIFRAYERFPLVVTSEVFRQKLNIMSFYTGINYTLIKFPVADARLFASLEPRFSYIHLLSFEQDIDYKNPARRDSIVSYPTKNNAFRIGGSLKLGIDGKVKNNFYVNVSFGISSVNLLLRDDDRAELFTPDKSFQDGESIVGTMNMTIMLQYRFN